MATATPSCALSTPDIPNLVWPPVESGHHLNKRGGTRTAKRVGTRDHGGFVMSEQAVLLGGWTAYHKLSAKDQAVFNQALEGFVGVQYTPFEVSTQVVAGTNYRFKCKTTVPLPNPIHGEAVVQIFQSLDGSAHITSITPI
ncbi:hypothetical protein GO604_04135 [Aeromonas hydrophila subsp. ranae]|nr:hypothetical protein [Aeromonas hydrophila subsp. ranae]RQM64472.1 hypothetical protein EHZ82_20375 [Aeromonas hydrophila]UNU31810.1 hypothetical protein GCK65_10375 [Aeromonas hydrophila]